MKARSLTTCLLRDIIHYNTVEFRPFSGAVLLQFGELLAGYLHPGLDGPLALGPPVAEPLLEHLEAGRSDEDHNGILVAAADLVRSSQLDLEEDVATGGQVAPDGLRRGAVEVVAVGRPLQVAVLVDAARGTPRG